MDLYFSGHDYRYAVEQTMLTLFPGHRPHYPQGEPTGASPSALVRLERTGDSLTGRAVLWWEGGRYAAACQAAFGAWDDPLAVRRAEQRVVRLAFYDAGVQALGVSPPWGALTGVRPVKLPTRMLAAGTRC